jgi:hypothetical protein
MSTKFSFISLDTSCSWYPRPSWIINNLESRTAINDVIAPEECQAFRWAPQWVCLGYQLKQTSSALKNVAHALRVIYLTFGHWGVPAALDISNIRTLKVNAKDMHARMACQNSSTAILLYISNSISMMTDDSFLCMLESLFPAYFTVLRSADTCSGMSWIMAVLHEMYEVCHKRIEPYLISREPVAWPWCNLAASQRRPYWASVNSHSPVRLVSR